MLQINNFDSSRTYSDKAVIRTEPAINTNETSLYSELASLSYKRQWVLFTSQCPRPSHAVLAGHGINCCNIIHMKPSAISNEEEIVIKAIQARTASAIVASSELCCSSKNRILSCAAEYNCKVFFQTDKSNYIH